MYVTATKENRWIDIETELILLGLSSSILRMCIDVPVLLHFGLHLVDPGGGVRGYPLAAGCIATDVLALARLGAASKRRHPI